MILSVEFAVQDSRRHAAGVCAGGVWQEQSSPGGTEDYRADRSTQGPKRPAGNIKMTLNECSWLIRFTRQIASRYKPLLSVRISRGQIPGFVSAKSICIF